VVRVGLRAVTTVFLLFAFFWFLSRTTLVDAAAAAAPAPAPAPATTAVILSLVVRVCRRDLCY